MVSNFYSLYIFLCLDNLAETLTTVNNIVEYGINDKSRETRHPSVRENVLSFQHVVWRWLCFKTLRYVQFCTASSWGHDGLCLFCINWDHVITVFYMICSLICVWINLSSLWWNLSGIYVLNLFLNISYQYFIEFW